jgi:hypothetical protein
MDQKDDDEEDLGPNRARIISARKAATALSSMLKNNGGDINRVFQLLHDPPPGTPKVLKTGDWSEIGRCNLKVTDMKCHNIPSGPPKTDYTNKDPVYVPISVKDVPGSRTNISTFDVFDKKKLREINDVSMTPLTAASYVNYQVLASSRLSLMFNVVNKIAARYSGNFNYMGIASGNPLVEYRRIYKDSGKYYERLNRVVTVDPNYCEAGSLTETPEMKNIEFLHYKASYLSVPRFGFKCDLITSYMGLHHIIGPGYKESIIDRFATSLDNHMSDLGHFVAVVMKPSIYSPLNLSSGWIVASDNRDGTYCVVDKLSNSPFNDPLPEWSLVAKRLLYRGFATQFVMGNNVKLMSGESINIPNVSGDTMVVVVSRICNMRDAEGKLQVQLPLIKPLVLFNLPGYANWKKVTSKSLWEVSSLPPNTGHYMNANDFASLAYAKQNYRFACKLDGIAALFYVTGTSWRLETRAGEYVDGVLPITYPYKLLAQCEIIDGNVIFLSVLKLSDLVSPRVSCGFSFATSYALCELIFEKSGFDIQMYTADFCYSAEGTIIQNFLSANVLWYMYEKLSYMGTAAYVKQDGHGVDFAIPVAYETNEIDEFGEKINDVAYYEMVYSQSRMEISVGSFRPDKFNHTVPFMPIVQYHELESLLKLMLSVQLDKYDELEVGVAHFELIMFYLQFARKRVVSFAEFSSNYHECIKFGHFPGYGTICPHCDVFARKMIRSVTPTSNFGSVAQFKQVKKLSPNTTKALLSPDPLKSSLPFVPINSSELGPHQIYDK